MATTVPTGNYADGAKDDLMAADRAAQFSARVAGIADSEHYAQGAQLHQRESTPKTAYSVAELSYDTWIDEPVVSPVSGATFGQRVKINYGLNGYTYLLGAELHVKLSTVSLGGGDGKVYGWQSYIGEKILGTEYTIKYQNEVQKKQNVDAMHFRRLLEQDQSAESTAAYRDGVRADAPVDGSAVYCIVPLDINFNSSKPFPMLAFSSEHELSFTVPSLSSLIERKDPLTYGDAAFTGCTATIDDMFLRCHVREIDQSARYGIASHTLENGLKFHVAELEANHADETISLPVGTAVNSDYTYLSTNISMVHPCAYLFFALRYSQDLEEVTGTNGIANLAALIASSQWTKPDRYACIPPTSWVIKENGSNFYPRCTWYYYNVALHNKAFNSENFSPLGVQLFTSKPLLAHDHSVGHITFSNLRNGKLEVAFQPRPVVAAGVTGTVLDNFDPIIRLTGTPSAVTPLAAAQSIILSIWSVNYNFKYLKGGRIFLAYQ